MIYINFDYSQLLFFLSLSLFLLLLFFLLFFPPWFSLLWPLLLPIFIWNTLSFLSLLFSSQSQNCSEQAMAVVTTNTMTARCTNLHRTSIYIYNSCIGVYKKNSIENLLLQHILYILIHVGLCPTIYNLP